MRNKGDRFIFKAELTRGEAKTNNRGQTTFYGTMKGKKSFLTLLIFQVF